MPDDANERSFKRIAELRFDVPDDRRRGDLIDDVRIDVELSWRIPLVEKGEGRLHRRRDGRIELAARGMNHVAAARRPDLVRAVVSRGGRPDLAGDALTAVQAPTLLIVGGQDHPVLELNQAARKMLAGTSKLEIVPGATHLFEEPGALDQVSRLAGRGSSGTSGNRLFVWQSRELSGQRAPFT